MLIKKAIGNRTNNFNKLNEAAIINSNDNVGSGTYPLVLIVDDIPFNIVAIQAMLESYNIASDSVASGAESVEFVKTRL